MLVSNWQTKTEYSNESTLLYQHLDSCYIPSNPNNQYTIF